MFRPPDPAAATPGTLISGATFVIAVAKPPTASFTSPATTQSASMGRCWAGFPSPLTMICGVCRSVSASLPATLSGSATVFYRFDDGATQQAAMLRAAAWRTRRIDGQPGLLLAPIITPPPTARRVEMWFHSNNDGPCNDWDSVYGRNWLDFPIDPPIHRKSTPRCDLPGRGPPGLMQRPPTKLRPRRAYQPRWGISRPAEQPLCKPLRDPGHRRQRWHGRSTAPATTIAPRLSPSALAPPGTARLR